MELRASGETVRRRLPDRHHELTAQEMQIAQLAAQGLTNREIGERIFLSHQAVGELGERREIHARVAAGETDGVEWQPVDKPIVDLGTSWSNNISAHSGSGIGKCI
jgi:hypothetical protein